MRKRITALCISTLLILTTHAQGVITITFNDQSATVDVPTVIQDVTYIVNGSNVTITSATATKEYTYLVKGTSSDGSLTINGNYKLTLQLSGVTLTNTHGGAAIDVECGKRIDVELMQGTVNTLCDSPLGAQKSALYFKGHAEFKSGGTLNVTGKLKHAICSKEYIELKNTTGFINILGAVSDGIHCGKGKVENEHNYFEMSGGTVNISNVGNDGIDADDFGVVRIKGGALSVNVADGGSGIKADSTLTVSGGIINIAVTGDDADGLRSNYAVNITGGNTDIYVSGDGSKGIKSNNETSATATVSDGGHVNISGGICHIEHLGGTLTDETGDTSSCVGISADKDLTQSAGDVDILAMGLESVALRISGATHTDGGTLNVTTIPWTIQTRDYPYDMTLYAVAAYGGIRLIDYSNKVVGAFIDGECVGYGVFESADYGILRMRSADTTSREVTFKLYDYGISKALELKAEPQVIFSDTGYQGTPSQPVVLNYLNGLLGDVNLDGVITVTDAMLIVSHILGDYPSTFHVELADLDGNDIITVTDVMLVVDIILHQ